MPLDRRHLLLAALAGVVGPAGATVPGPIGQPGLRHPGRFIWFDLATDDPDGARSFYAAVFGWRFERIFSAPAGYTLIENASGRVGGIFRQARPARAPVGSRWLSLASTADVQRVASQVTKRGGQVVVAPTAVAGRGTHAVFRDPQGAVFGVLAASGGDPPDDPVTAGDVFWLDLFTPDPRAAAAFYASIFGYEVDVSGDAVQPGRWILAREGIARAGVVALPPGAASGPGWLPYILVDGLADVLRRAAAAGGRVVLAPRAQWLRGEVAVIADPNGGVIGAVDWWAAAGAVRERS